MAATPTIGDVIEERYRLDSVLGRGGHGIVFQGVSLRTRQLVAVKIVRAKLGDTQPRERLLRRFNREIAVVARLQHPHVVRLLDQGSLPGGEKYAVFEHLTGRNLRTVLLEDGPLPIDQAARMMGQVAMGAGAAHELGILHRDLKPDNIMVCEQGTRLHAVILDFGISSLMRWARPADYQSLTTSDSLVGSLPYTSPERIAGREVNAQSDIYAWGLIFLEALTGTPAVAGRTPLDIANMHMDAAPIPIPRQLSSQKVLASVLRRAVAKNKADRFGSMREVVEALEPVIASAPSKRVRVTKKTPAAKAGRAGTPWWRRLGSSE